MKCPKCGNELKKGIIEAKDAGSLTQSLTMMTWYPEEYKNKMIKKNVINLQLKAEGFYCDECMKVFASFEEKQKKLFQATKRWPISYLKNNFNNFRCNSL